MRLILTLLLWAGLVLQASALQVEVKPTLTNAGSNQVGTEVLAKGFTTATIHVCCVFNATITFKASIDGTNFEPLGCVPAESQSALVSSTTIRGLWRCNIIGFTQIRADLTNYVSGVINVNIGLTAAGVS
ncbi:MAG: hypothetical protein E6Q97_03400 [Desulfurellales bacterium]|nr:MAG: hypothetical protein E6Q97_03400 [Desulfurellales bacterium]